MAEVVIGVLLTAAVGGLLVPTLIARGDRRRERIKDSSELLETLAASLWTYWKLAMRVAYYGRKGSAFREDFDAALNAWDGDAAWDSGAKIQIQISRSKRVLLPGESHDALDLAQRAVVEDLDVVVDRLRERPDTIAWGAFYDFLLGPRRGWIHELLFLLTEHLAFAQEARLARWWRTLKGTTPASIREFLKGFKPFDCDSAARNPNEEENMADRTDVLLHLYEEERTQARHTEEQRATLTNIVLLVVAAALAYVTSRTDDVAALVVSAGVMVLGLYGAIATGKYFERWMRHWRRAYAYQTQLLDLYPEIDSALATFSYKPLADRTDPYEAEVEKRFPHLSKLRLYRLWVSFHCAVALAGAVMVVVFSLLLVY